MRERIEQELAILRRSHRQVQHAEHGGEDWFLIPDYPYPPGWKLNGQPVIRAPISFKVGATYHAAQPYGFMTPAGLTWGDQAPNNATAAAAGPFAGSWLFFSWQPADNWQPTAQPDKGSNLFSWVRGFADRLKEGV